MEDLDVIQRFMKDNMNIGGIIDLEKFVDLRFANEACKADTADETKTVQKDAVVEVSAEEEAAPCKPQPAPKFGLKESVLVESSREGKYIIFKMA
jgi:hypothetical protein